MVANSNAVLTRTSFELFLGDCYMVTSIPSYQNPDNAAAAMCHFALDMIDALNEFNVDNPDNKLDLRVGINTGPVVAGVVGTSRFLHDLWGDSVNLASRMESTGIPSRVQITQSVVDDVEDSEFLMEARGKVQVKGKGLVSSFFLEKRLSPNTKYVVDYDVSDDEGSLELGKGRGSTVSPLPSPKASRPQTPSRL